MAKAKTKDDIPALPLAQEGYQPGEAFDEMYTPDGKPRPHFEAMHRRLTTLTPDELAERQRKLEHSFLLQGITFTVYGAQSTQERIIPTDLIPRVIAAEEWKAVEAGLIQRLQALNLFLADIYGEQRILKDGVVPRDLVLGAFIERAQLSARLLEVSFGDGQVDKPADHTALTNLLRMACGLEPYLRVHSADIDARLIMEFLLLNEDFPRSIRFSTARIEQHLSRLGYGDRGANSPARMAGRLKARLEYADLDDLQARGAGSVRTSPTSCSPSAARGACRRATSPATCSTTASTANAPTPTPPTPAAAVVG